MQVIKQRYWMNPSGPVLAWRPIEPYCRLISSGSTTTCQGIDLSIILDVTGSMKNTLDNAKNSLNSIINSISNKYGDYRLSLFAVTDDAADGGLTYYDMLVPFSLNNESQMQAALDSLTAGGGTLAPEPHDLAFQGLLNGEAGQFRENITKAVFIISDAPNGGDDDNYGSEDFDRAHSLSADAEALGIKVYSVTTYVNEEYLEQTAVNILAAYVGNTGGTAYISQDGTVDSQIVEALGEVECEEVPGERIFNGFKGYYTLEEYDPETGLSTGNTKQNLSTDPDAIPPVYSPEECPLGGVPGDENFGGDNNGTDKISIHPTQLTFPVEGGTQSVVVTADSDWTAYGTYANPSTGGSGETTVTIIIPEKDPMNEQNLLLLFKLDNNDDQAELEIIQ